MLTLREESHTLSKTYDAGKPSVVRIWTYIPLPRCGLIFTGLTARDIDKGSCDDVHAR